MLGERTNGAIDAPQAANTNVTASADRIAAVPGYFLHNEYIVPIPQVTDRITIGQP